MTYKMPIFDEKHRAISSRITSLEYLKNMSNEELIKDSCVNQRDFKLMEFCYDPENIESLDTMLDWLDSNEYLIKNYYGNDYLVEFPSLDIYSKRIPRNKINKEIYAVYLNEYLNYKINEEECETQKSISWAVSKSMSEDPAPKKKSLIHRFIPLFSNSESFDTFDSKQSNSDSSSNKLQYSVETSKENSYVII